MKKKKMGQAFVWRKSIYYNYFKCNECGALLFDEKKMCPTDNAGFNGDDTTDNRIFCMKCKNIVGVLKYVPMNEDEQSHMEGLWDDKAKKYIKDFEDAEKLVEELKQVEKTLKKKLSEVAELESKISVLENKCNNKDAESKSIPKNYKQ